MKLYLTVTVTVLIVVAVLLIETLHTPSPRDQWRTPIFATALLSATCEHLLTSGNLTSPILTTLTAELDRWNAGDQAPIKAALQNHIARLQTALNQRDTEAVFRTCLEIEAMTRDVYREAGRDGVYE